MRKLACVVFALGAFTAACGGSVEVTGSSQGGSGSGPGGGGVGGVDDGGAAGQAGTGGNGGTGPVILYAHDYYVQKVHPSLRETCAVCHFWNPDSGPAFLDSEPELSYILLRDHPGIVVAPDKSTILLKPAHEGPSLSADQRALVTNWINLELGAPGDKSQPANLLSELATCMDIDIWLASGMDKVSLQNTDDAGQCIACHHDGLGAAWLSPDSDETFQMSKSFPFIMRYVLPIYLGNDAVDLKAANELIKNSSAQCQSPNAILCHPKYTLTPESQAAIEKFVELTLTKFHNKACGP